VTCDDLRFAVATRRRPDTTATLSIAGRATKTLDGPDTAPDPENTWRVRPCAVTTSAEVPDAAIAAGPTGPRCSLRGSPSPTVSMVWSVLECSIVKQASVRPSGMNESSGAVMKLWPMMCRIRGSLPARHTPISRPSTQATALPSSSNANRVESVAPIFTGTSRSIPPPSVRTTWRAIPRPDVTLCTRYRSSPLSAKGPSPAMSSIRRPVLRSMRHSRDPRSVCTLAVARVPALLTCGGPASRPRLSRGNDNAPPVARSSSHPPSLCTTSTRLVEPTATSDGEATGGVIMCPSSWPRSRSQSDTNSSPGLPMSSYAGRDGSARLASHSRRPSGETARSASAGPRGKCSTRPIRVLRRRGYVAFAARALEHSVDACAPTAPGRRANQGPPAPSSPRGSAGRGAGRLPNTACVRRLASTSASSVSRSSCTLLI
jgi:hypothetical protein